MKKLSAHILLLIFSTFMVCMAVDYSSYLEMLNGSTAVEDINTGFPEEHHENHKDNHSKSLFALQQALELNYASDGFVQTCAHRFSIKENPYLAVPYSPPEQI